jgi:hypothetical protein
VHAPPLWLLCVLRGGPLMPCLRLLLCNDSLFDITARHRLYTAVLQLVTHMAGEQLLQYIWGWVIWGAFCAPCLTQRCCSLSRTWQVSNTFGGLQFFGGLSPRLPQLLQLAFKASVFSVMARAAELDLHELDLHELDLHEPPDPILISSSSGPVAAAPLQQTGW